MILFSEGGWIGLGREGGRKLMDVRGKGKFGGGGVDKLRNVIYFYFTGVIANTDRKLSKIVPRYLKLAAFSTYDTFNNILFNEG